MLSTKVKGRGEKWESIKCVVDVLGFPITDEVMKLGDQRHRLLICWRLGGTKAEEEIAELYGKSSLLYQRNDKV